MHVFPVLDPSQVRDPMESVRWFGRVFRVLQGKPGRGKKNKRKPWKFLVCIFLLNLLRITGRRFSFYFF